jgi:signal peptidase I
LDSYPYSQIEEGPQPRLGGRGQFIREILETALLILTIYTLVNLTTARYMVEGNSMEPNFHDGQYIIVSRLAYMLGDPQRGDVIVFHYPKNPDREFIKRITGLPGETISVHDGQVFADGVPLEEPYIEVNFAYSGEWTLGPDEFFVLGDNRTNSNDSHDFGPIDRSVVVGRAWISYWPPQCLGIVSHHTYAVDGNAP